MPVSDPRLDILTEQFAWFMQTLWLDLADANIKDTPHRVAKMFMRETCKWLFVEKPTMTTFPNTEKWSYDGIVLVKDIAVRSLCEHHFQPFIGFCHIAYIPTDKILWLSKFARLVNRRASRPQTQERLTMSLYYDLQKILGTEDIAITMNAEHFCMKVRWVHEYHSSTVTSKLGWRFGSDSSVREQFYHGINRE